MHLRNKIKVLISIVTVAVTMAVLILPSFVFALQMPKTTDELIADYLDPNAQAYIVQDAGSGQILVSHNADQQLTPASLTKLVTALVVLDTKPKLSKTVAVTAADQKLGACGSGGSCIKAAPGIKFTIDGLFHAMLLPSANNAAAALARSTGLTTAQFAARMNKKVASLGATHSHFNEPTGMDSDNLITAGDYAKIIQAAFANKYLAQIAGLTNYTLRSSNNSRYTQTIKNTDKLLSNNDIQIIGAKTGYLTSYNFAAELKYQNGPKLTVVVLGEPHLYSAFDETSALASLAAEAVQLGLASGSAATAPN